MDTWHQPFFGWGMFGIGGAALGVLLLWSLIWKGIALWRAARNGDSVWFMVFLVLNTAGILEILYLYIFSNKTEAVTQK